MFLNIYSESVSRQHIPVVMTKTWMVFSVLISILTFADATTTPKTSSREAGRREFVCSTITVAGNVSSLEPLANCTVIEGNLEIRMIDAETKDFDRYRFPLREITGYLLLFRVYGLRSLQRIFPNLTVIRGRERFFNYAFMVYEMLDLENIGLAQLTVIEHGAVRFERNPDLCYVNTIDWSRITKDQSVDSAFTVDNVFRGNKPLRDCVNFCPAECRQAGAGTWCWDSNICQKVPGQCESCGQSNFCYKGQCCHPECLGECTGPTQYDCIVCRHVFYNGSCVDKCPPGLYEVNERRCISDMECKALTSGDPPEDQIDYKLFNEKGHARCLKTCPSGYMALEYSPHHCVPCGGNCPTVCRSPRRSFMIDTPAAAKDLEGCSVVHGDITITINSGERITQELEQSLGNIEEVHGQIKVISANALTSLSFFKKLRRIKGAKDKKYALFLLGNKNLEQIWSLDSHPRLSIENGIMFIQYNRKLCWGTIVAFFSHTDIDQIPNAKYMNNDTNGDLGTCSFTHLKLSLEHIWYADAIIKWTTFKPSGDERKFISYLIYYTKAPDRNVSIASRDACGKDIWKVRAVKPRPVEEQKEFLQNLTPFTWYAAYVKTFRTDMQGAISNLLYFKTAETTPTVPRKLIAVATGANTLHLSWKPPKMLNSNAVTYNVVLFNSEQADALGEYNKRNFCLRPQSIKVACPVGVATKADNVSTEGLCCRKCEDQELYPADWREHNARIAFENYIQIHVFNKRQDGVRRRKRSVGDQPQVSTVVPLNTTTPPYSFTSAGFEIAVVSNNTQTELTGLHHFTSYTINVAACLANCSDEKANCCSQNASVSVLTCMSPDADVVSNVLVQRSGDEVFVQWRAPSSPNGIVLYYDLQYWTKGNFNRMVCITNQEYLDNGGHRLVALRTGQYSFRVRANSLAGAGNWSEPVVYYMYVDDSWSPAVIAGIVVTMFLLTVLAVIVVFVYFKRREQRIPADMYNATYNQDYWSTYVKDEWEVDRDKIELLNELGQGSFGLVFKGIGHNLESFPDGVHEMHVAVKTCFDSASARDKIEFLNEASVMKEFNCFHVVRLLGVVSEGQPAMVVMELMSQGDLKNYLRRHRPDEPDNDGRLPPTLHESLQMAAEIADGMAYLAAKKFVHRDLAARNCMVDDHNTVKIGDFGMTRDVYDSDYYRKGGRGLLPVRWMAPEALKDGVFTSASDVWSFGVVIWEIATLAAQPYPGLANEQVLKYVFDGGLMEIPENCDERLLDLMQTTWQYYPKQRPTFQDIIASLDDIIDDGFRELSYYHSEENQADLTHKAEKEAAKHPTEHEPLLKCPEQFKEDTGLLNGKVQIDSESKESNGDVPSQGYFVLDDEDSGHFDDSYKEPSEGFSSLKKSSSC